jgi:hypothetical protein
LYNLCEFQKIWSCWLPNRYSCVDIIVDSEKEEIGQGSSHDAISTFSGGVDSCNTVYYHKTLSNHDRQKENICAGLIIHGFDIPLSSVDTFTSASKNSKSILESIDVELITIATNFRELGLSWHDSHGSGLASSLSLFSNKFTRGLIPSGEPYHALANYWGSHPLTDRLLSSDNFQIIHDGAQFTRIQKIKNIIEWSEALNHLRVCWEGKHLDRNCGKCEKCIRTILDFRAINQKLPPCFEENISNRDICKLIFCSFSQPQLIEMKLIVDQAQANKIKELWVYLLRLIIIIKSSRVIRTIISIFQFR